MTSRKERRRYVTQSISYTDDYRPVFDEIEEDFGTVSQFVRQAADAYLRAKGARGKTNATDALGVALLKRRGEELDLQHAVHQQEKQRIERRLEEYQREEQERTAADAHSLKFETPEALVQHWWPRVTAPHRNDGAWRNLSDRYGHDRREVLAVAHRHAAQTTLPTRPEPKPRRPPQ